MLQWGDLMGMERASKLMRGLNLPAETMDLERIACSAWAQSVGRRIAAHTRAVRLVRTRLVVEVEDNLWQRQLFGMTGQILAVLEKNMGRGLVDDVEFRVVPRRREPKCALAAVPAQAADDAAEIEDPVLRSIYKASRKKALA